MQSQKSPLPSVGIQADINRGARRHGFSLIFGPNYYQLFSWSYAFLDQIVAYILILSLQNQQSKIAFLILYSIALACMVYSCFRATLTDTTDTVIYEEHEAKKENRPFECKLQSYCLVCRGHVRPKTKHCGSCNRCTSVFDHHCIWLNNCIGDLNYRYFIVLVVSICCIKIMKIALNIIQLRVNQNEYTSVLAIISLILDPFLMIVMLYLLTMHIYFSLKKITTYEWIRMKREKKEQTQKKGMTNESANYLSASKRYEQQKLQEKQSKKEEQVKIMGLAVGFPLSPENEKQELQLESKKFDFNVEQENSFHAQAPPKAPEVRLDQERQNQQLIPSILTFLQRDNNQCQEQSIINLFENGTNQEIINEIAQIQNENRLMTQLNKQKMFEERETLHNLNKVKETVELQEDLCTKGGK